jgi:hypothetical protein
MRRWSALAALGAAAAALVGARVLRAVADGERASWPTTYDQPYAPSPEAAPFVALGYRELLADVLWGRMLGYLGGRHDTAAGVRALVEATAAADPHFWPVWETGARAMISAHHGVDRSTYLAAIALLEQGMKVFPDRYELPELAGTIYTVDLHTRDPAEKRRWEEQGALLIEKAIRMPDAPAGDATFATYLRTKLGQRERAVRELREMLLITDDRSARKEMLKKLAQLEARDQDAIEAEIHEDRARFATAWEHDRPELPPNMYILVGPRPLPYIDFTHLAVDRDLIGSAPEPLPPIDYSPGAGTPPPSPTK